jgi:uncharacterized membrane protein YhfC
VSAIRDAIARVEVGQPQGHRNLTVVPLLTRTAASSADSRAFADAHSAGEAMITEVSEQGVVPQLRFVNRGRVPVLLVDGEELLGAKQNRIVNLSILVPGS